MNDTANFVIGGIRYVVDVDGVNCHEVMMTRLPDGSLVRLTFLPDSLVPEATRVDDGSVGDMPVRNARIFIRTIEFPAFGHRYQVTVPEGEERLDECLGRLPDGTYVVLYNPHEIIDAPFEHVVSTDDPLFTAAQTTGRIYEARQIS